MIAARKGELTTGALEMDAAPLRPRAGGMKDLRQDLTPLWRRLQRLGDPGQSRSVLFVAARSGEGTSSLAASFAMMAADKAHRACWLVDLDFRRNPAFKAFDSGAFSRFGALSRAYDAALGEAPIYDVPAPLSGSDAAARSRLLAVHQVGDTRLLVTRFRTEAIRPGERLVLKPHAGWWQAVGRAADWIVVDAPALEASSAALSVAGQVDGVVLVVAADRTRVEEAEALRDEISGAGGAILGVVLNGARSDARFADSLAA